MAKRKSASDDFVWTPWGTDGAGKPILCSCGCRRVAHTIDWDTLAPLNWPCVMERAFEAVKQARATERRAAKAKEKVRAREAS